MTYINTVVDGSGSSLVLGRHNLFCSYMCIVYYMEVDMQVFHITLYLKVGDTVQSFPHPRNDKG